jgi:hypothetical protein
LRELRGGPPSGLSARVLGQCNPAAAVAGDRILEKHC